MMYYFGLHMNAFNPLNHTILKTTYGIFYSTLGQSSCYFRKYNCTRIQTQLQIRIDNTDFDTEQCVIQIESLKIHYNYAKNFPNFGHLFLVMNFVLQKLFTYLQLLSLTDDSMMMLTFFLIIVLCCMNLSRLNFVFVNKI